MRQAHDEFRILAWVAALASPAAAWAGITGNEPFITPIPTLDGTGLAALGGVLAMAGTYLLARGRGRRKK